MNRHLLIVAIIVMLVCIGFCGCINSTEKYGEGEIEFSGISDRIKLVGYNVTTVWQKYKPMGGVEYRTEDGFSLNQTNCIWADNCYHTATIEIKNVGEYIDRLGIYPTWCDEEGETIFKSYSGSGNDKMPHKIIADFPKNNKETFSLTTYHWSECDDLFNRVSRLKIEFIDE